MDLTALYDISYGMYIIGANDGGKPVGCIANTVVQITSENPILAVSINKENYTYEVIKKEKKLAISILSEDINPELIGRFGFQSSKDIDKYDGLQYEIKDSVPALLEKCCGTLTCEVINTVDMETHVIFLARLVGTYRNEPLTPMTYSYYHKVMKGKAPKTAPTYQEAGNEKEEVQKEAYVCTVCGYIYEGDIETEPDDYVCPICQVGKDMFVKK